MNRTSGALALVLLLSSIASAQPFAAPASGSINTAELNLEIKEFLGRELAAHLSAIESLDPPPDKIYGAGTTGEFSWGTFMRAVAAYAELTGESSLAGRDLAREVAQIGLLEYRLKSTRFSQLYAVLALRHFGHDLKSNRVWQSLSEEEQAAWRKLLDISAFYDPKSKQVINLPENYLGVADYLPAPHGLSGFSAPVEQVYPSLVPFIQLADGRVLVAGDGADEIEPAPDGRSLRVVWRRWALVGGRSAQPGAVPLTSEVLFRIEGASLIREETLKTAEPITLRRWWVTVPATASEHGVEIVSGQRRDWFRTGDSILEVSAAADWPLKVSVSAAGDSILGRGARGAVPLHLVYQTRDLLLTAQGARRWRLILRVKGEER